MKQNLQSLPKSQRMAPPSYTVLPQGGANQQSQQKVSHSPQKFGEPLLHGAPQNSGSQLSRTINPHKSQTLNTAQGQVMPNAQYLTNVNGPNAASHGAQGMPQYSAAKEAFLSSINNPRQELHHKAKPGEAGSSRAVQQLSGNDQQVPQADPQQHASPLQQTSKSSHKNKIEQKNRNMNQAHVNNRNNKNVADAQKRIAKIIREQDRNQGGGPPGDAKLRPQLASSQKSRNQAIQQSKSENLVGGAGLNDQYGSALASGYNKVGNAIGDHSPKQLLLNQQKKLSQQNSNAQYHTASNTLSFTNQSRQALNPDLQSRQSSSISGEQSLTQGVNKIRTSSGVRNKPSSNQNAQASSGVIQGNFQGPIQPNSQNSQPRQNPRAGQNAGASSMSAAQRDKNTSHSQPPASHSRIEKPQSDKNGSSGTSGMQQSKSQNQLTTYRGFIMTIQQQQEYMKMEQEQIERFVQSYHPAKFACKKNGVVSSYSANTHQGIVRNYNEDRVSIILNIIKPKFKQVEDWPRCSFFAVYDGHGGSACADFLRDQLHQLIVRDENFPKNPKVAIENGIAEAEKLFLEWAHQQSRPQEDFVERSGTCAIIVLIVGDICYVANVGDSRAIMSVDGGEKILLLSKDHKPEDEEETRRVEEHGGQIYQNKSYVPDPSPDNASGVQMIIGPHRVFPGRLSVSRTLGDIEAKDPRYGGNPNCVVATPDIKCFKIRNNYDYIVLGCDGVFEKLDNKQVINSVWEASKCDYENDEVIRRNIDAGVVKTGSAISIHQKAGLGVDKCLHDCVMAKTLDNITAVMIAFENFENKAQFDVHSKNEAQYEQYKTLIQKRSLEPVIEEYIEEEPDAPVILPEVVKEKVGVNDGNTSHHESPHILNKRSRVSSSNKHQQISQGNPLQYNNQQDNSQMPAGNHHNSSNNAFSNSQPIQMSSLKTTLNPNQPNGANTYQSNTQLVPNQSANVSSMSGSQQLSNLTNLNQNGQQNGQGPATGQLQRDHSGSKQKRQNQSKSTLNLQNKSRESLNLRPADESGLATQNLLRGSGASRPQNSPSLNSQQPNLIKSYQSIPNGAQKQNAAQSHQVISAKIPQSNPRADSMKASRVSSNRETEMGARKSGSGIDQQQQITGQQSMLYALTNKPGNVKERTITYGQNNNGSGTPVRGTSASQRRKLIAQQTQKYFKQQLGVSHTFRDGTPRQGNNQIPQIGAANAQSNRIKSSRQSERHQIPGSGSGAAAQGRAITPKQAKQMYASINVNKNRNSSQSKLTATSGNEAYLTHQGQQKQQTPNSSKYVHSVQNLQTAARTSTNISNMSNNNNDYHTNKSSAIGINMSSSLMAVGNMNMAANNFGIHKQTTKIPQKMTGSNFNSTQALAKNLPSAQQSSTGHYQALINPMGFGYNTNNQQNAQSGIGGTIKLKFDGKTNQQSSIPPKNQTINLTGKLGALADQAEQRRPLGGSQSFMEGVRYKKASAQLQMMQQPGLSHGNFSGTHKGQVGVSQKAIQSQGQQNILHNALTDLNRPAQSKMGKSAQFREGRNASNSQKPATKQQAKVSSHSQRNQGAGGHP